MKKILSISIAAYNVENFIEKTLSSFIADESTMDKLEVIVVNDGSSDNTAGIARKYVERYPKTFILIDKENGGYGSTINCSLQYATGKYFRTVDGDDWVDTKALMQFVHLLELCNSDMVLTKYCKITDGTWETDIISGSFSYDGIEKEFHVLPLNETIQMQHITFRLDMFVNNKITFTEHCFYTDMEYNLKAAAYVKTVTCFDAVLYMYRVGRNEQSVSLESWHKNIDQALKVSLGLADYWKKINAYENIGKVQKDYIKNSTLDSIRAKYRILLSMPDVKKAKNKVIRFDHNLQQISSELYKASIETDNRKYKYSIWFMRKTKFMLYEVFTFVYRKFLI